VAGTLTGSLWVRGLLTIAVLAVLASRIDLRASLDAALRLQASSALAVLALLAIDRGVMIWRWMILLRARGAEISAKSAVWIYLVSSFVGGFLPAGVGADVARAYALSQRTSRGNEAVASIAIDRLLGLLSIAVMGTPRLLLPIATAIVVSISVAMLWADRIVGAFLFGVSDDRTGIGMRIFRLAGAVGQYREHRAALGAVALLSLAVQVLRILQAYLLGRGIGLDVPFSYYLLFMPIGLIALLLPISISGIGAPQGIIVWLLAPAGVPAPEALALSTLIVLSGIVANLPGAWLYLRAERTPSPERTP
jgi:uncharacterized membrane protein YbhN (UPF0104 family)